MTRPNQPTPKRVAPPSAWHVWLLRLASPLRWLWSIARLFHSVLAPTRVALFLIVAALLLLVFHEQGQDLAVALVEDADIGNAGNVLRWTLFLITTLWWSIQSWLWSRIALDRKFGPREDLDPASEKLEQAIGSDRTRSAIFLIDWVPRLYAFLVFVLAVVAISKAGGFRTIPFWLFLILGAVVLGTLWQRRRFFERRKLKDDSKPGLALRLAKLDPTRDDAIMGRSRGARILAWSAFGLAIAMTALVTIDAVGVGAFLGAPSVSFLAFASILVALGIPAGLSVRYGFPLITTLLILAGILGLVLRDAHTIPTVTAGLSEDASRSVADIEAGLHTDRRSLDQAWSTWRALSPSDSPRPIAFVATAGGGVRAALWTSIVLDRAGFAASNRNHLFAISGVSGGALGATFYQAWLGAAGPAPAESCPKPAASTGTFGRVTACALTFDQLGPAFAAALYGDLLYTFTPFWFLPDSASALTGAWENGWRRAVACPDGGTSCEASGAFTRNFLSTWKTKEWMPALMLNGTHVETGKRIITTDIRLSFTKLEDAWDFHAIAGKDIRTSMAALNASRFPGLVAGGTILHKGKRWGHIVDGGYFENSGGQTLTEVAREVLDKARADSVAVRSIFIEIVSDPELKPHDYARLCVPSREDCVGSGPAAMERGVTAIESPLSFMIGVTGPVVALANVRSGRGVLTPKLLARAAASAPDAIFVQFRLCPADDGATKVPLGWLLSKKSATSIAESLPTTKPNLGPSPTPREICRAGNWSALKALEDAVAGKK